MELPNASDKKNNKDLVRAIIHLTLDEPTWSAVKITNDTPLSEFADTDYPERKGYVLIGELEANGTAIPFNFELRTDSNDTPTLLAAYPSTIEDVIHLELPDRIDADHTELQKENGRRVNNLLEKMKK